MALQNSSEKDQGLYYSVFTIQRKHETPRNISSSFPPYCVGSVFFLFKEKTPQDL